MRNSTRSRRRDSRLYSAVAFANAGGSLIDSPGIRLVASDDGGATWKLIDSALVRSGNTIVCDFAAAPTGTTIYATTSPGSCGGMGTFPTITLWRSDNGGQSWPAAQFATCQHRAENGMVVSSPGLVLHLHSRRHRTGAWTPMPPPASQRGCQPGWW